MNGLKPGVGSSGQQWKVAPKIPYMLGNRMGAESFAQCEGMEKVPKQAGISFAPCGAPPSYSHALAQNVWISCPCAPGFRPRGPDSAPSPNPTLLWVGGTLRRCALHLFCECWKWKMENGSPFHFEQELCANGGWTSIVGGLAGEGKSWQPILRKTWITGHTLWYLPAATAHFGGLAQARR